jgi:phospholipase D1/2
VTDCVCRVGARIAIEGRSCWRRPLARRVAFLVDGAAYFAAFAAAAERAQRSIFILAWDVNSGVRLRRDGHRIAAPDALGDFLTSLLARRPALHVNVLDWDFAMIYALERESLPVVGRAWTGHPRLHFQLDGTHPLGASHHQKVVVIDDALAFVGGLDLAACRWDTSDHAARDPRRVDPGYRAYPPFHDVQMMVDGDVAASLGELARTRWLRATGVRLPAVAPVGDPWPPGIAPDVVDVPVAIARTEPAWNGRAGVYEVEALFVDAIAAARRAIYLEMQYLTSSRLVDALAVRLGETDGPEVVIVLPRVCSGWLEEATMGTLRARVLRGLAAADRFGRLRLYHPVVPGLSPDQAVNVHAKVAVVDDDLVRIGSANASNRSLRLDTECDLVLEAEGKPHVRTAIAGVRDRLVAEHLGVAAADVAAARARAGGALGGAIEALRGGARTLVPLELPAPAWPDEIAPDASLLDPDQPVARKGVLVELLVGELSSPPRGFVVRSITVVVGVLVLALAWRWTPLGAWVGWAAGAVAPVRTSPLAALGVVLAFVAGGLLLVPATGLMVATTLVFGPLLGFAYALLGALASALVGYALGRVLARGTLRHVASRVLHAVNPRLARRVVRSVATGRLVPIAPFTVVNLVAGASGVDFPTFTLRTVVMLTAGTAMVTLLADRFADAVRRPGIATVASLLTMMVLLLLLAPLARRRHWGSAGWAGGEELG